jgi:Ca2+-binding EF-hand superfamily protein
LCTGTQDTDGNGTVELEEFLQWSIRNKGENNAEQQLRGVFDVFDKNKDGFIDRSELTQVGPSRLFLPCLALFEAIMRKLIL